MDIMFTKSNRELTEAQITIIFAAFLQLMIDSRLTIGSKYTMVVLEIILAISIGILAMKTHWFSKSMRQLLSVILIAIVTIVNISSLFLVISALFDGSNIPGRTLVLAACAIFLTNIILFSLWYWELDRPGLTGWGSKSGKQHFLFPQTGLGAWRYRKWKPSFFDYLYLSTTNATAFSPTDTMPLTLAAKVLMGLQAIVSLLTLALVAARAINILA